MTRVVKQLQVTLILACCVACGLGLPRPQYGSGSQEAYSYESYDSHDVGGLQDNHYQHHEEQADHHIDYYVSPTEDVK